MEIQATTLHITRNLSSVIWYINNNPIARDIFSILVWRKYEPSTRLGDINNITSINALSIQIQDKSGICTNVSLPERVHTWLIRYFQNSPGLPTDVDCLWWIVEILGWDRGDRFVDDGGFEYLWFSEIDSISSLIVWDVICMCNDVEWFNMWKYHYALYIGNDVFLSKLGFDWPIVATSISQLMDIYPEYNFLVKLLLQEK
jgi:hypothetical protein